jgi:hypothetical protein
MSVRFVFPTIFNIDVQVEFYIIDLQVDPKYLSAEAEM